MRSILKFTLIFLMLISLVACCAEKDYESFKEAYEKGTIEAQIKYAMENDMLTQLGFEDEKFSSGGYGKKTYDKNGYEIIYFLSGSETLGYLYRPILDCELSVKISNNNYRIRLKGETFSRTCYLSKKDYSLLEPMEYIKDYNEILSIIQLEDIKESIQYYYSFTEDMLYYLYELQ